jgi:two-component system C4-dicarboxylate transport sensor histidine kinase DctB
VGVIRDITTRKEVEKQLAESEARLVAILENIQAGIVIIDAETRQIIEANPKALAMMGRPAGEVIGAECHRLMCPSERGNCPVLDCDAVVDTSERLLLTGSGEQVPILKTVAPLGLDNRKQLLETFLDITDIKTARDILERSHQELEALVTERTVNLRESNRKLVKEVTERKHVEQQLTDALDQLKRSQVTLVQAEKMSALGVLTAGIAHELNNPLMGMLNFTQYCLKHTDHDDRRHGVLQDTIRETERCIDIVRNLLIFSRMEKVDEEQKSPVRIDDIFDRVMRLFDYRIGKTGVQVDRVFDPDLPPIALQISNFQQVLLNLVGNALDALDGRPDPQLCLRTERSAAGVRIAVEDNGCGVAPDIATRIFDPFYTTKPPGKGTGLGLSVCSSIVANCGGSIDCLSLDDGRTAFRIELPLDADAEE